LASINATWINPEMDFLLGRKILTTSGTYLASLSLNDWKHFTLHILQKGLDPALWLAFFSSSVVETALSVLCIS